MCNHTARSERSSRVRSSNDDVEDETVAASSTAETRTAFVRARTSTRANARARVDHVAEKTLRDAPRGTGTSQARSRCVRDASFIDNTKIDDTGMKKIALVRRSRASFVR